MCGIIGIIHPQSKEYIEGATNIIEHRGPDGADTYTYKNLSLGHRRLAIVDLSVNGLQPMHSLDERYIIVFNGEIYNHQEFRSTLLGKYKFKSTSDTETLLYGLIEYGEAFLKKINGIFAFAFLDKQTGELLIVRDQFGIKPLYYYQDENTILFGSEIKSFLAYPQLKKDIDYKALANYLHFLWSPDECTPFLHVKKLRGGHLIYCNINNPKSTFEIKKYYDIPMEGKYFDAYGEEQLIDLLEQKLLRAVERQLMSDVPVGFFLSGGLDSTAIVAMAKKLRPNEKLKCYTIKNNSTSIEQEGFSDDLPYARLVAKHFDCDLVEVEADIKIFKAFDAMIYHLDEPQSDIAPLNVQLICKQAKKDGYKVLLGGTAGDDLFSGYRRHQALNFEPFFRVIPKSIWKILSWLLSGLSTNKAYIRRIKKLVTDAVNTPMERKFGYFRWLPLAKLKKLFNPSITIFTEYNPINIFTDLLKNITHEKNELNQMLYWELKTFLPDQNLNYTDKMSMAEGVEVRVPFLDLELLEFSCCIPPNKKMKGMTTKYILRKLMERYVPKDIIYRSKAGFGGPLRKWISEDLSSKIDEYLSEEAIKKRGIFNYEEVRKLIEEDKQGKNDFSYSILSLLAIESWYRSFID